MFCPFPPAVGELTQPVVFDCSLQDMGLTEVGQYLRVMKLMRFFPVMMRTASLEIHTSGLALFSRVSKLAFPLFLVFHIVACFWISFGTHGEFGQTVFVPSKAIGDMPSSVQYVISLFWALSVLSVSAHMNSHSTLSPFIVSPLDLHPKSTRIRTFHSWWIKIMKICSTCPSVSGLLPQQDSRS
uniref:Ion transport domain-containing protein n=1 Tax=Spongospora subterranea TaxID=70186 RepID=A0A0H5RE52_9EUKA|eukprot:CRZ12046.1 hypothetical protein [Spongospora subterranea]